MVGALAVPAIPIESASAEWIVEPSTGSESQTTAARGASLQLAPNVGAMPGAGLKEVVVIEQVEVISEE